MEGVAIGSIRVANEVIASIAAMAATEVEGVAGMDRANARQFAAWARRGTTIHRGVRVGVDGLRGLHLDVFLTVNAGGNLGEIAERVQANVIEAVERTLGLKVAEINVLVSSIAFAG